MKSRQAREDDIPLAAYLHVITKLAHRQQQLRTDDDDPTLAGSIVYNHFSYRFGRPYLWNEMKEEADAAAAVVVVVVENDFGDSRTKCWSPFYLSCDIYSFSSYIYRPPGATSHETTEIIIPSKGSTTDGILPEPSPIFTEGFVIDANSCAVRNH